ncbi:lipoyl(octanoyl) transferase LipB [Candidatus Riesia pediculicola]|uniref:Octanoyltransferase n=1 Tax=Riesia pediculicola (strain USDA) TaxID=515618 RepID=D4G7Q0_RIEPU|nr:lipoyl(octanoyl) transferase LipB [Candidatus Riesia pediculicola]ADD79651.1 lipoyltransferase [Candidatus Riesia pediculicola USDA]ARC53624.1 octanoyltransferase [Candidatus Riesia pediculicola]QOJ86275.1 lipoyl(octanoyl) transferase LipB [Candidatus Riesia pediculicola]
MFHTHIRFRNLGIQDYRKTYKSMIEFSKNRVNSTPDEIWLVEHFPVFTLGKSSIQELEYIFRTDIPIVQSDRGGKITYHGPGQQIMYVLLNLKKRSMNVGKLISSLEKIVISLLKEIGIHSYSCKRNRGIYVNQKKISSLGLKISRGCSFHGLSINVKMDLSPFNHIVPCGLSNIEMTQISEFFPKIRMKIVRELLLKYTRCLLK